MTPLARLSLAVVPAVPPAKRQRPPLPPGSCRITVGWESPEGEAYCVAGYLTPGRAERGPSYACAGEPAEPAEFCPLTVVEDRPGGVERPELLPLVEADLDTLTAEAEEIAGDRAEAAAEDRADAQREDESWR